MLKTNNINGDDSWQDLDDDENNGDENGDDMDELGKENWGDSLNDGDDDDLNS
jgi:hypothetical protein